MSESRRIEHLKRHPNDLQSKYRLSPKPKNNWLEVLGTGFIAWYKNYLIIIGILIIVLIGFLSFMTSVIVPFWLFDRGYTSGGVLVIIVHLFVTIPLMLRLRGR